LVTYFRFVLLLLCVLPARQAAAAAFGAYHPARIYAETSSTSFLLPMRDGVQLAIRLYRPMENGRLVTARLPVIWHATLDIADNGPGAAPPPAPLRQGFKLTEDSTIESAHDLSALTQHGYVVAIVARRGAGASFGRRRGYEDLTEAEDSYEITEWLARQSWSDGNVGVYGCSNTGEAAMHVLAMRPPHLKAVFAGCFSFNRFDGFVRGGIIANWGAGPQRTLADDLRATPVDGPDGHALLEAAARSHTGSTYLLDLMRGMPYRDSFSDLTMSRFWYEASVSSYLDAMRASGAALYIQGGWRDDFRAQGLLAWANYLPGKRFILIGDWTHCANSGFDLRAEELRFYDAFLKGIDTGIKSDLPIHYQTVDPGHATLTWHAAATWPVSSEAVTWQFGADGTLSRAAQAASTQNIPIETALSCPGGITDPRRVALSQPCDPSAVGARWSSPALTADTTVTGHPLLHVEIGASISEPRIFAYLEDVFPDGHAEVVTDARLALALRKTALPPWDNLGLPWHEAIEADQQPLLHGETVAADVAFLPISYMFPAGHKLRVAIAGADPRERLRPESPPGATLTIVTGKTSLTVPEQ
jgi:putative CocE/NonD family hydrolase